MEHITEVTIDFTRPDKPKVASRRLDGPDYNLPHDHQLIDIIPLIPHRIDLRVISKDRLPDKIAKMGIRGDSTLLSMVIQSACGSVLHMMKELPKEEQATLYKVLFKADQAKLNWINESMYHYYIPLVLVIVIGSILLGTLG